VLLLYVMRKGPTASVGTESDGGAKATRSPT